MNLKVIFLNEELEEFMMHKARIIGSLKPFHFLFASIRQKKSHNSFTLMLDGPSSQACTLSFSYVRHNNA